MALSASLLCTPIASAASITFVFDYYTVPPHSGAQTPVGPGGPWGTLKLTDSVVDPNRVDVEMIATPPAAYAGANFEQFYLNFIEPFKTNHQFYLVPVNEPAGVAQNGSSYTTFLGSVGYTNSNSNLANFFFDINPDPTSGSKTFVGSMALYNQLPSPDVPVNLDVSMFDFKTAGNNSPPMYAAYRLNNFNPNPPVEGFPNGEFWAFASQLPEPGTLLLTWTGLFGLGALLGRRSRVRS